MLDERLHIDLAQDRRLGHRSNRDRRSEQVGDVDHRVCGGGRGPGCAGHGGFVVGSVPPACVHRAGPPPPRRLRSTPDPTTACPAPAARARRARRRPATRAPERRASASRPRSSIRARRRARHRAGARCRPTTGRAGPPAPLHHPTGGARRRDRAARTPRDRAGPASGATRARPPASWVHTNTT